MRKLNWDGGLTSIGLTSKKTFGLTLAGGTKVDLNIKGDKGRQGLTGPGSGIGLTLTNLT